MIELVDVKKGYGATEVLKGVNLKVGNGDFIAIRGKSGAGKTTLLKLIGMLESPDSGKLKIFGYDVGTLTDTQRSKLRLKHIGFVFQFFNLIPSLTVLENIELPLALAGVSKAERRRRALEFLKYFELLDLAEKFPDALSGGERQRIAVIRALVKEPKLILADEPTSNLDDENSELLLGMLSEINKERGVTVILTTTDLNERVPSNKEYLLRRGVLTQI